jgi:hypothetical protein
LGADFQWHAQYRDLPEILTRFVNCVPMVSHECA